MDCSVASWWQRKDLCYINGQLHFADRKVADLARQFGTPSFVYSARRIEENIHRLQSALISTSQQPNHRLFYAMKANRFAPLLTFLRQNGLCGIDVCSPEEVFLAASCGFNPEQISFTAPSLSAEDLDQLARFDGLLYNADSLSSICEWGRRKPGTEIGIRINPAAGVSREDNELLQYSGFRTTKFGIYREQFTEALALAAAFDLKVTRIHFHTGCGYLTGQLEAWRDVLNKCVWFIDQVPGLARVNIGGGLGVPHTAADTPLDLERWATIVRKYFSNRHIAIDLEPGEYLVKDAGLLLLGITFQEMKRNTMFLGVNGGFNIAPEPAHYRLPFEPVPICVADGQSMQPMHLVGNINEALDIWYENVMLPDMSEQQYIALINSGAYSSAMSSNHCMRGQFREYLLL